MIKRFTLWAAMLTLSSSTLCLAQTTPTPPQRFRVTVTQVKPDMLNEWMDLQKNEVNPAMKKSGVARRTVLRHVFGNTYEFISITPLENYASLDAGGSPFAKALGPEGAARLGAKTRKCINSSRSYVGTGIPELSLPPDATNPPPVSISTRVRLAQGKRQDWINFQKNEILPLYKKAKAEGMIAGLNVSGRGFGSSNTEVSITTYYNKFADLDGGNVLGRVAGGQGAATKIFAKGAGLSTTIETVVRRRVEELSYR